MNNLRKKILKSLLVRNWLTLRLKVYFDKVSGKNTFLFHGKTIKHTNHTALPFGQNKKILFPTIFFLDRGLAWQTTVAKALEVRGHEVVFMPLDIRFPKYNALYYDDGSDGFVIDYYNFCTQQLLNGFSLQVQPYSQFGNVDQYSKYRDQVAKLDSFGCKNFVYRDLPLGEMTLNNLIHYFRCSPNNTNSKILDSHKDFLAMGMIMHEIISKALDIVKPDVIFTLNGSFLDSQLQLLLAKQRNIPVITFEAGFMLNSLLLGVDETCIRFPMTKYLPAEYHQYSLDQSQEKQLDNYLHIRSMGKECVFDYWNNPVFDHQKIRQELGLNNEIKPDILFTNLLWDSALLECDIAFNSQLEWIIETIKFYSQNPHRTLLVRIHPAEINPSFLESMDKVQDLLKKELSVIPNNVIIIPPNSDISSYPLTELSAKVCVYSSTAGLEAAIMGKQVIVAGKVHYRGQGFTLDINTKEEYIQALQSVSLPYKQVDTIKKSRKYAYFLFFGFSIPFDLVTEHPTNYKGNQVIFNYHSEDSLLPGKDKNLDFIIDTILNKTSYRERLAKLLI